MNKKVFSILVISFILSLIWMNHSFGLYRNSKVASGTLATANWSVSLNQSEVNDTLSIVPNGANDTYTLNITSTSEVDIKYSIIISNLPAGVEASLDGVNFESQNNHTITFTDIGTILYTDNDKTKTHTITFRALDGATVVNNQKVDIDVTVQQIL